MAQSESQLDNNYQKLRKVLAEIFQLDQADLDFGIYRIMNQKRDDINDFLDNRLLPQVKEILSQSNASDSSKVEEELANAIESAKSLGVDPETLDKVKELRVKLGSSTSLDALEQDVYSHLANFFKRYYKDGDFISLRRYKKDVYAIPYEGEEVKLHWANHDQYYIKTSEYLKNYGFKLSNGKSVKFELKEASTEQNNNKEQSGKERRFSINEECPFIIDEQELTINFTYEAVDKKVQQVDLIEVAYQTIISEVGQEFQQDLLVPIEGKTRKKKISGKSKDVPLDKFYKHLRDFTTRNSFDYFIHKDLGGFLTRELDFYIKNEVLFIDDINTENEQTFTAQLSKIKALKQVADKIIVFLTQLEEFQKKLWLKKKFVVSTNYCITLDNIPEDFYPEVAENKEQLEEWKDLFSIHSIEGDLLTEPYSEPLSIEFLKSKHFLPVDTKFFQDDFKYRLLSCIEDFDQVLDGHLINSENYQALGLIQKKFQNKVESIYIDPPYNTGGDDFLYKDNYQESSWLSMISERMEMGKSFFKEGGSFHMSIDIKELDKAIQVSDCVYGVENRKSNITIKRGSLTGAKVINPGPINISENLIVYSAPFGSWTPQRALRKKGYDTRYGSFIVNIDDDYSKWEFISVLDQFAKEKGVKKSRLRKELGQNYETELLKWVIDNAENIIRMASLDDKSIGSEVVEMKKESKKNSGVIFHLPRSGSNDYFIKDGNAILFYKHRLSKLDGQLVPAEPISDIWDDVLPNDLHNEGGVELRKGKKPEKLIQRVLQCSSIEESLVLDFFLGSGTTAAVAHKMNRKWIGIDSGEYFDQKALKRQKRVLYGETSGISAAENFKGGGIFKYQYLESYEDTINNLSLSDIKLPDNDSFQDEYILNYMLDVETNGSLLNTDIFKDPFNYKLNITRNNESIETKIDLIETFNYLIGLYVKTIRSQKGYVVIEGVTNHREENTLIIWRNTNEKSNEDLNEFFRKQDYSTRDTEFDRIYVNGDNLLENLKTGDEKWKVVLIEEEFKKRMFDVQDV